jgi:hypothetical protein
MTRNGSMPCSGQRHGRRVSAFGHDDDAVHDGHACAVELPRNGVRNARPHRLRVRVAGLGCGGFSRLGLGIGKSEAEAVAPVRQALDRSVNLPDTAAVYGTDGVVGRPGLDPPFSMPGISSV